MTDHLPTQPARTADRLDFHVTVYLDPSAFGMAGPAMEAIDFDLANYETPEGALEGAYAICNSYPEEMWASMSHLAIVREYRERKHRSLSVGDVVRLTRDGFDQSYRVARIGFEPCEHPTLTLPDETSA